MRQFHQGPLLSVIFILFKAGNALNLLLLGDSIDRQTVIEWCQMKRSEGLAVKEEEWGGEFLTYKSHRVARMATLRCNSTKDSVAFVHMFGSNATGPYLHFITETEKDPYIATKARIDYSFKKYVEHFGSPDRIILQFANWDIQRIVQQSRLPSKYSEIWNTSSSQFEKNMLDRLEEVRNLTLSKKNHDGDYGHGHGHGHIEVGIRTAVWSKAGGEILHEFNRILRNLAETRKILLFDYDYDIWSIVNFERSYKNEINLFRDFIHPKQHFTAIGGEKQLGRQFSQYLYYNNNNSLYDDRDNFQNFYFRNSSVTVKLFSFSTDKKFRIIEELISSNDVNIDNDIYYFDAPMSTVYNNISSSVMALLKLGKGDIYLLPSSAAKSLDSYTVYGGDVSRNGDMYQFRFGDILDSKNGTSYLYEDNQLRQIPTKDMAKCLEFLYNRTSYSLNDNLFKILPPYSFGTVIPSNLPYTLSQLEGSLLRFAREKTVYVVHNGKRKSIESANALMAMGKTFDDVIVTQTLEDLEIIPLFSS